MQILVFDNSLLPTGFLLKLKKISLFVDEPALNCALKKNHSYLC